MRQQVSADEGMYHFRVGKVCTLEHGIESEKVPMTTLQNAHTRQGGWSSLPMT